MANNEKLAIGIKDEDNVLYRFIPPAASDSNVGGIKASPKTTQTQEVKIDPTTNRLYVDDPTDDIASVTGDLTNLHTTNKQNLVSAINEVNDSQTNIKEDLTELKSGNPFGIVKQYKAVVKNTSSNIYTNYPCRIMVNFEQGVCRSENHISVLLNGQAVPYEFEPCADANIMLDKSYGYYPDGSVKSGYITILASVGALSEVVYDVYINPVATGNNFTERVSSTESGNNVVYTVDNEDVLSFWKTRYTINGINGTSCTHYLQTIDTSGVGKKETDANNPLNVLSYDFNFYGKGYVYRKINV